MENSDLNKIQGYVAQKLNNPLLARKSPSTHFEKAPQKSVILEKAPQKSAKNWLSSKKPLKSVLGFLIENERQGGVRLYQYEEIRKAIGRSARSVDNAIQRLVVAALIERDKSVKIGRHGGTTLNVTAAGFEVWREISIGMAFAPKKEDLSSFFLLPDTVAEILKKLAQDCEAKFSESWIRAHGRALDEQSLIALLQNFYTLLRTVPQHIKFTARGFLKECLNSGDCNFKEIYKIYQKPIRKHQRRVSEKIPPTAEQLDSLEQKNQWDQKYWAFAKTSEGISYTKKFSYSCQAREAWIAEKKAQEAAQGLLS